MDTTLDEVKQTLAANLNLSGIDLSGAGADTPLFGEGLGLDSLDAIELVIILRKNYGIVIDNLDDGKRIFQTLATLREHIARHRTK
ncbi:MAG: phosphopantetheine-binding protein [Verrucomicrobiales bacterium]|jgi:acyl carrier protein|nr:phosphopantetheine-binding protein [Verrucomicrobiales bacterium]